MTYILFIYLNDHLLVKISCTLKYEVVKVNSDKFCNNYLHYKKNVI